MKLIRLIAYFFAGVSALLGVLFAAGFIMRMQTDINYLYIVDNMPSDALKEFSLFLIRYVTVMAIACQSCLLISQVLFSLVDLRYAMRDLPVTKDAHLTIFKYSCQTAYGFLDRGIPLLGLGVLLILILREYVRYPTALMEGAMLTRRLVVLPSLTGVSLSWAVTLLLSLVISLIFYRLIYARQLFIYNRVFNNATEGTRKSAGKA